MGDGGTWNLWVLHDPKYVPLAITRERSDKEEKGKDAWDKLDAAVKAVKEDPTRIRKPTTFQGGKEEPEHPKAKPVVMAGGADRIENLLPKQ
jgi:hypothetical protein